MNIEALLNKTRNLIGDIKRNTNQSASDTLVSDDQLMDFFNLALEDFDFRTNYNRTSFSADYNINSVVGQQVYNLPDTFSRVFNVKFGDNFLKETNYNPNEFLDVDILNGTPVPNYFQLDYENGKIRLFPTPQSVDTISFRGVVESKFYTIDDFDAEIPLPKRYQLNLMYFIAAKAVTVRRSDNEDYNQSQFYMNQWLDFCRRVKLEISRRTNNVVIISNGEYNVW